MKKTTNLGLDLFGIALIDRQQKFKTWRLAMCGEDDSNMIKIDNKIGQIDSAIATKADTNYVNTELAKKANDVLATTSTKGQMSPADKSKLDSIILGTGSTTVDITNHNINESAHPFIQGKIDEKVKVDSVSTNVNFIENQVVNGIGKNIVGATTINCDVPSIKSVIVKGVYNDANRSNAADILIINGLRVGIDSSGFAYFMGKGYSYTTTSPILSLKGLVRNFKITVAIDGVTVKLTWEFGDSKREVNIVADSIFTGTSILAMSGLNDRATCLVSYTTSQQEIQHNISVLNNSPSIAAIETTDSEGHKTSFLFATDTDHVQDRTGRVQEEINRVFYKNMCKEFTSSGTDIVVNNGMDGYVLSGMITGQTVKNYAKIVLSRTGITSNDTFFPPTRVSDLPMSKGNYLLAFYVDDIVGSWNVTFSTAGGSKTISNVVKGWNITTISKTLETDAYLNFISSALTSETGSLSYSNVMIIPDITYLNLVKKDDFFLGLSSTKAVISNNGLKYSFYEPTIQGKTRVMKAAKGTQNWVEISEAETRDTTTYDYKLESIIGLGSVPNVADCIDRARKVKVVNTKDLTFDDTFSITLHSVSGEFSRFRIVPKITDHVKGGALFCNNFKYVSINPTIPTEETVNNHSVDGYYDFWLKTIKASTVELFKAWLQANPVTIRYQLATPIEISMTDEEIKAYDAYRKVIDLGGLEGARNTLEIKEDGSGVYTQNTKEFITKIADNWRYYSQVGSCTYASITGIGAKTYGNIVCSNLKTNNLTRNQDGVEYGICLTGNDGITIGLDGVYAIDEFKAIIDGYVIRYQLATPIVTHIPKELVPAILTQATNEFKFGDAVKPSSVEITVPVDKVADLETRLAQVEAIMNTASNLSLQANYAEDEYNNLINQL